MTRSLNCPGCGKRLQLVERSPTSALNEDQFNAVKAGDYFCTTCPNNHRGQQPWCYWWEHELTVVHEYQI